MPTALTAETWNAINHAFWRERQPSFERQLSDPLITPIALERLYDQQFRGVPVAQQSTLEHELDAAEKKVDRVLSAHAEQFKKHALSEQAARGGRAEKRDALQRHIESQVARNPDLTVKGLLIHLKRQEHGDLIVEVDEELGIIEFKSGRGDRTKTAAISGLKDRLSRAKKFVSAAVVAESGSRD